MASGSASFSARANFQSMSFSQFSAGLGAVQTGLASGSMGRAALANALRNSGVQGSFSASASGQVSGQFSASMTQSLQASRMVSMSMDMKVRVPVMRQVPDLQNAGKLESAGNTVTTPGGYKVRLEGDTAFVTAPNGKEIKVWGDPHIEHSDGKGGKQNIDFRKGTTSFALPDGTRITMNAYGNDGKLAANGLLGKVDIYNGNKHVQLSNGREGTGKTGNVGSTGVQGGGFAKAAAQDAGDVLHVVGDGAQLAHKGKLTQHESVSGTVRKGEWNTGAAAGPGTVGAKALEVPQKTMLGFQEINVNFQAMLDMQLNAMMQKFNQTLSNMNVGSSGGFGGGMGGMNGMGGMGGGMNAWGASGSQSIQQPWSINTPGSDMFGKPPVYNAFQNSGGFGAFGSGSFNGGSMASIGGAMGGAGLYGGFGCFGSGGFGGGSMASIGGAMGGAGLYGGFNVSANYNSFGGSGSFSANFSASGSGGFPGGAIAGYIGAAAGGAMNVMSSYNQSMSFLSQSSFSARF